MNATNYDTGGQGVSYNDTEATNQGTGPRQNEGVDTQYFSDAGGENANVGWINEGEWLEFTVDVVLSGEYEVSYQVASRFPGQFRLEFDRQNVTGTVNVASTGGWSSFTTISSSSVFLNSGQQTMRLFIEKGPFNIADISFELQSTDIIDPTVCLLYTSPSPRDRTRSRMPSSA